MIFTRDLALASLMLRLPRRLRAPLVYESHGMADETAAALPTLLTDAPGASAAKRQRLARREARVWHHADGYVTITRGLAEALTERFGPRRRWRSYRMARERPRPQTTRITEILWPQTTRITRSSAADDADHTDQRAAEGADHTDSSATDNTENTDSSATDNTENTDGGLGLPSPAEPGDPRDPRFPRPDDPTVPRDPRPPRPDDPTVPRDPRLPRP